MTVALQLVRVAGEVDPLALAPALGLHYVHLSLCVLLYYLVVVTGKHPCLGVEVVMFGKKYAHGVQVAGQSVLAGYLCDLWNVVDPCVGLCVTDVLDGEGRIGP